MSRSLPTRWKQPSRTTVPRGAEAGTDAEQRPIAPAGRGRADWQFGLGSMFQSMFLLSVMAAIYGGMVRSAARKDPFSTVIFVGLSITSPMALMMLLSGWSTSRTIPP